MKMPINTIQDFSILTEENFLKFIRYNSSTLNFTEEEIAGYWNILRKNFGKKIQLAWLCEKEILEELKKKLPIFITNCFEDYHNYILPIIEKEKIAQAHRNALLKDGKNVLIYP